MGTTSRILGTITLGIGLLNPNTSSIAQAKANSRSRAALVEDIEKTVFNNVSFEQPYPIVLTEEGKKWVEKNEDIFQKTKNNEDGGLIDASTFLAPDQIQRLDRLCNRVVKLEGVELVIKKLDKVENGFRYTLDVDYDKGQKERWYISGQAYYLDQFPSGEPAWISAINIWKGTPDGGVDKLTQNYLGYFKLYDVINGNISLNSKYLLNKINQAKENRQKEIDDAAGIKNFDLPKDETIGYIGLADGHDLIFADGVNDVKYFAEAMAQAGYKMVSNEEGKYSIAVNSSPKEIVEKEIQAFLEKGVKNIYLKLAGHGNTYGVYFTTKDKFGNEGSVCLSIKDLRDILDEFPECKFTVTTDACSAAGYAKVLKDYKDPTGKDSRITSFLQCKIYATNQEGRLKGIEGVNGAPKIYSTYYDVFFIHYLTNGSTFGEAHLLADKGAKVLVGCDAEGWRSGSNGGISTAGILNPLNKGFKHYCFFTPTP